MKQATVRLSALLCCLLAPIQAEPIYGSSVVGTDFDLITDADLSAFSRLEYKGLGLPEMPDKRNRVWPLRKKAHVFVAFFKDGTHVQISVHAGLGDEKAARTDAMRYAPRIGKLPTSLRRGLERIVVQPGGRDTTAFADEGMFVLYSANATKRIGTHDLEETIFHESVHAAWDRRHRGSEAWKRAQKADGRFLTRYAKRNPRTEDLAESALFAYTLLHHPDRFPEKDRAAIKAAIPARIAFVGTLVPAGEPIHFPVKSNLDAVLRTVESDLRRLARAPDTSVHDGWRTCGMDLGNPARLSDVLSNALMHGLDKKEADVAAFLRGPDSAERRKFMRSPGALLKATAKKFGIEERVLVEQVRRFLHCNCKHANLGEAVDDEKMAALEESLRERRDAAAK